MSLYYEISIVVSSLFFPAVTSAFQLFTCKLCLQFSGLRMRNFTWNRFPIKNLLIDSLLTPTVRGRQPFASHGPNVEWTLWRAGIFINTIIQTHFSILRYIAIISIIPITKRAKYMYSHFNNIALMWHLMLLALWKFFNIWWQVRWSKNQNIF